MEQRQVWQAFLGWWKPAPREDSVSSKPFALAAAKVETVGPSACFDEAMDEADEGELLDFLAADLDPVPADPEFRERLREGLWALVQDGATSLPKDH